MWECQADVTLGKSAVYMDTSSWLGAQNYTAGSREKLLHLLVSLKNNWIIANDDKVPSHFLKL